MSGSSKVAADVVEQAQGRLRDSPYQPLKRIVCIYHAGVLTLRGRLPSYYLKQIALALVCRIEGVGRIEDGIEVEPRPPRGDPAARGL